MATNASDEIKDGANQATESQASPEEVSPQKQSLSHKFTIVCPSTFSQARSQLSLA
jgi:hypothetical protein